MSNTDSGGFHVPAGTSSRDGYELDLDPARAGWEYSSLRVLELAAGEHRRIETGPDEIVVLPLSGSCTVTCDGRSYDLSGRTGVFASLTDFVYVPRDADVVIESEAGGRFALPGARARRRLEPRYVPASDIPVELRGAGQCSRQIVSFCGHDTFEADRLIAVEVLTPAGNWSSFPPHKHDEEGPDELPLEEMYYFEVADGPDGPGIGYQRVYGTQERPIDVLAEVRTGDVVLIPHGWHGPSMSVPGYDMYYLNVMAGPSSERDWRICIDPHHDWVRETWSTQAMDPRLPLTSAAD